MVNISGVKFESLRQTTSWIISNLSSVSHHVFMDVNTLLDALDSSRLFDKNFIDEKYHAQKGKFKNETTARVAASFGRELLTVFGKVDSSVVVIIRLLLCLPLKRIRRLILPNLIWGLSSVFLVGFKISLLPSLVTSLHDIHASSNNDACKNLYIERSCCHRFPLHLNGFLLPRIEDRWSV